MTKLVIIDDHEALREGLAALLGHGGMEVVGAAGNVAAGVDLVEHTHPDVAIVDIRLPDGSGIDLTRELLARRPDLGVILYTGDSDAELLYDGLDSGARSSASRRAAPTSTRAWTGSCCRRARPRTCPSSRRASARSCI
jgi:DNA-binding NarL/FixJ family response regulator